MRSSICSRARRKKIWTRSATDAPRTRRQPPQSPGWSRFLSAGSSERPRPSRPGSSSPPRFRPFRWPESSGLGPRNWRAVPGCVLRWSLGRHSQKFHRTAANNTPAMLFLAVVALVMPAVFDLALYGTLSVRPPAIDRLSLGSTAVLICAYVGSRSMRSLFTAICFDPLPVLTRARGMAGRGCRRHKPAFCSRPAQSSRPCRRSFAP
jgi:hypothetical protein